MMSYITESASVCIHIVILRRLNQCNKSSWNFVKCVLEIWKFDRLYLYRQPVYRPIHHYVIIMSLHLAMTLTF